MFESLYIVVLSDFQKSLFDCQVSVSMFKDKLLSIIINFIVWDKLPLTLFVICTKYILRK